MPSRLAVAKSGGRRWRGQVALDRARVLDDGLADRERDGEREHPHVVRHIVARRRARRAVRRAIAMPLGRRPSTLSHLLDTVVGWRLGARRLARPLAERIRRRIGQDDLVGHRRAAIGRSVLGSSSVGARVREGRRARSTSLNANFSPIHTTSPDGKHGPVERSISCGFTSHPICDDRHATRLTSDDDTNVAI